MDMPVAITIPTFNRGHPNSQAVEAALGQSQPEHLGSCRSVYSVCSSTQAVTQDSQNESLTEFVHQSKVETSIPETMVTAIWR